MARIRKISAYCVKCRTKRRFERPVTSFLLHGFISLVTGGLWIPVWVILILIRSYQCATCSASLRSFRFGEPEYLGAQIGRLITRYRRHNLRVNLPRLEMAGRDELQVFAAEHRTRFPGVRYYASTLSNGHQVGFGVKPGKTRWIDVFARTPVLGEDPARLSGPYFRYGFSMTESRWSHGDAPEPEDQIRAIIRDKLGGPSFVGQWAGHGDERDEEEAA